PPPRADRELDRSPDLHRRRAARRLHRALAPRPGGRARPARGLSLGGWVSAAAGLPTWAGGLAGIRDLVCLGGPVCPGRLARPGGWRRSDGSDGLGRLAARAVPRAATA